MKSVHLSFSVKSSCLAVLLGSAFSTGAVANGALPSCLEGRSCQMGGATVAESLSAASGNINPALMANVGHDTVFQPAMDFQREKVNTSNTGLTAGTPLRPWTRPQTNQIKFYMAAFSGVNYQINDKWAFGMSTGGGGNNARYDRSIVSPDLTAPRKLRTLAVLGSKILTYKPDDHQAYGLALILGYLQLKSNLTQPNGMVTRGNDKTDWGFGIGGRLGGQWHLNKCLSFGLAASTPIVFQKLRKYRDVLTKRPELPPIVTGGLSWHVRKDTDLLLDVEGNFWRTSPFFGKTPPVGQKWKNTVTVKTGVQHRVNDQFTLRAGYQFGQSPIPKDEVLYSALSEEITVSEHVLATGMTFNQSKKISYDLGLVYHFPNKIRDNGRGVAGPAARNTTIKASAIVVILGFSYKY